MSKIAVIGAGISGLTVAQELSHDSSNQVIVFEKEANPGGLIRCKRMVRCFIYAVGISLIPSVKMFLIGFGSDLIRRMSLLKQTAIPW